MFTLAVVLSVVARAQDYAPAFDGEGDPAAIGGLLVRPGEQLLYAQIGSFSNGEDFAYVVTGRASTMTHYLISEDRCQGSLLDACVGGYRLNAASVVRMDAPAGGHWIGHQTVYAPKPKARRMVAVAALTLDVEPGWVTVTDEEGEVVGSGPTTQGQGTYTSWTGEEVPRTLPGIYNYAIGRIGVEAAGWAALGASAGAIVGGVLTGGPGAVPGFAEGAMQGGIFGTALGLGEAGFVAWGMAVDSAAGVDEASSEGSFAVWEDGILTVYASEEAYDHHVNEQVAAETGQEANQETAEQIAAKGANSASTQFYDPDLSGDIRKLWMMPSAVGAAVLGLAAADDVQGSTAVVVP